MLARARQVLRVNIDADTADVDLFVLAGSPAGAVLVAVTIAASATVYPLGAQTSILFIWGILYWPTLG